MSMFLRLSFLNVSRSLDRYTAKVENILAKIKLSQNSGEACAPQAPPASYAYASCHGSVMKCLFSFLFLICDREEERLVDLFVLDLLVAYVYSLRMAHKDDKSLGTQEQCTHVIIHLERMIKAKSALLLKGNKDRRKPRSAITFRVCCYLS